jgi:prepilin-type N-terminal cleavage/methylation domain-containing protein
MDEMKRGFTLLEIIVVIVILGIMATLAATQYTKMVEKARGAEARLMLGAIRKYQIVMMLQRGSCSATLSDVGIGGDYPSACASTHYFTYNIAAVSGNMFTAVATRCTTAGKVPNYTSPGTITLLTNFTNGTDAWTTTSPY